MKNIFRLLIISSIFLSSCDSKFQDLEYNFSGNENPVISNAPIPKALGKKGACWTITTPDLSKKLSESKVYWHYSWGTTLSSLLPDNVEFVPMTWGKWGVNDALVAKLKDLKSTGKIHYLLGFNEPDGAQQANMTVDQAIALWPMLEKVGVPLGSPATVDPTGDWMKEFMQKASDKGLRIDFVTVHSYGGNSSTSLINKMQEVYNLYRKPIWITEFAVADWSATSPLTNKYTPAQVLAFMKAVLPQLEALDYVQRYSWFSFNQSSSPGTSSALYDADGNLTPLGVYYANFKPNVKIGPPK